jgi:osmotically-inducible protein OsmY
MPPHANDTEVRFLVERTDPDIARDAVNALANRLGADNRVTVTVHNGFVALEGRVDWLFQRATAESTVKSLRCVCGVRNDIVVRPRVRVSESAVRRAIENELKRSVEIDPLAIRVDVRGGTVALSGTVRSCAEREAAERAASHAQGVTEVKNQIEISY